MSTSTVLNNANTYEVDTKLDKAGEVNLNLFENRYSVKFSNFPNLVTRNDLRYLDNEYLISIGIPALNINTVNNRRNGHSNIIPLANRENSYKTSMTFKIDENLYNYFILRDYIMVLQEGNKSKEIEESEFYADYKIDFIQIDFLDNSANPKVTRSMFLHNVFVIGVSGLEVDETKKRVKFNCEIEYERESKQILEKV